MFQKVNDFRVFFAKIPEAFQMAFEKALKNAVLLCFSLNYSHHKKEAAKKFFLAGGEKRGKKAKKIVRRFGNLQKTRELFLNRAV